MASVVVPPGVGSAATLPGWLEANNATVMGVVLLVIGVVLIGKGSGSLL